MPDYQEIYEHRAGDYQRLVAKEDYKNNLLREIGTLCPLSPRTIAADLGAGTGRVSFLLSGQVGQVYAVEPSPAMRGEALRVKASRGIVNVHILEGNHLDVPLEDGSVDVAVAGWSFAAALVTQGTQWQETADRMVTEIRRITKPGGAVIIIETLGTMKASPDPPANLLPFYERWEKVHGFTRRWIRTDYRFDSPEEAGELIEFFFGPGMAAEVRRRESPIVPECTGVWHRTA